MKSIQMKSIPMKNIRTKSIGMKSIPIIYSNTVVSSTGVFLWVLSNFQEHLFWKSSANGCFWLLRYSIMSQDSLVFYLLFLFYVRVLHVFHYENCFAGNYSVRHYKCEFYCYFGSSFFSLIAIYLCKRYVFLVSIQAPLIRRRSKEVDWQIH